jgi:hypothetical protein
MLAGRTYTSCASKQLAIRGPVIAYQDMSIFPGAHFARIESLKLRKTHASNEYSSPLAAVTTKHGEPICRRAFRPGSIAIPMADTEAV